MAVLGTFSRLGTQTVDRPQSEEVVKDLGQFEYWPFDLNVPAGSTIAIQNTYILVFTY